MTKQYVNDLSLALGSVVSKRRAELGLSQEQLSRAAGVNRAYLSEVEHGTHNTSLNTIDRLALALNFTLVELMARVDEIRQCRCPAVVAECAADQGSALTGEEAQHPVLHLASSL